jgi:hypothetical protein
MLLARSASAAAKAPERVARAGGGPGNAWTAARSGESQGWGEDGDALSELGSVDEAPAPQADAVEGADALAGVPTLAIQNSQADPGGKTARTKVGVGEINWITPSVAGGTWSATGGKGTVDEDAWKWVAPEKPGNVSVTYTVGKASAVMVLTVVAPTTVTGTKTSEMSFGAGEHGSGMTLDLVFGPTDVSFANLGWLEKQGAITGTDIFKGRELGIKHNEKWSLMGGNNEIKDTAESHGFPKPWGAGTCTFDIDEYYRVGSGGTEIKIATVQQVHTMAGSDGSATTSKAGATSASRKP